MSGSGEQFPKILAKRSEGAPGPDANHVAELKQKVRKRLTKAENIEIVVQQAIRLEVGKDIIV